MECPRCGTDLKYRTRFCPTCGTYVDELTSGLEEEHRPAHLSGQHGFWAITESERKSEPEPEPESEPVLEPEQEDAPEPEPEAEPEPKPKPEPVLEPRWEAATEPEPVSEPEAESESVPEPVLEPEPEPELAPKPDPEPEPKPKVESSPEPVSMLEPEQDLEALDVPSLKTVSDVGQNEVTESPESPESTSQAFSESDSSVPRQLDEPKQSLLDRMGRSKRAKTIVVGLLAVLVVGFGIFQTSTCVSAHMERERAAAEQRRLGSTIDQEVTVVAANYDPEQGAPIPLHVTGDAKNGTHVDETMTVDVRDPKLALMPGTYVITAGGSLATDQGAFYHGSIDSYTVEVRGRESAAGDGTATDGEEAPPASKPVFAYELVAPEHVTDADLEAVRTWMAATNVKDSQRYVDAVTARRAEAQQRIAEESAARDEEERLRTEETAREVEEALQSNANTQVTSDRVSFTLPESWQGRVQTSQTVGATGSAITVVHLPGNQYAELARVFFSAGYVGAGADGTLRHVASWRNSSDGTGHAEVQTLNWPLIAAMGAESQYGVTQSELNELVSLSTGGAVSSDYARSAGGYDTSVSQAEPNFSAAAFSSLAAI